MSPDKKSSSPTIKAFLFVIFIISVILLFRFTPLAEYLHPQALKEFIDKSGPMAPVLFILAYATGICLFLPATLFTGIGAVLFGTVLAFYTMSLVQCWERRRLFFLDVTWGGISQHP
jgi:uncharacterized membrane protein YdjX (TVP38/TMEM64 family)